MSDEDFTKFVEQYKAKKIAADEAEETERRESSTDKEKIKILVNDLETIQFPVCHSKKYQKLIETAKMDFQVIITDLKKTDEHGTTK
jgi:hypothetical protein